jgi:uncharacterized membrane protein|uniref:DUF2177 family protein n=1 Tax=viral metagenome TaxID=1070528 RepID=A0A6C0C708_9ZZZZ
MKIRPIQFILTSVILLAIDAIYLKFIGGPFYSHAVKKIQGSDIKFRMYSAFIVYIMLITGLYYFVIGPNKTSREGAFFGLVTYGVFDFTNHAILNNYSLPLAIMDTVWGAVLCGSTTFIVTSFF